ncbi:MAG: GNAT family N-acetyltransferase [Gammaproteobacteria bacterium]|nr:GNAT family N-acetyltransferase [Gammaproteobacteria bacterium]
MEWTKEPFWITDDTDRVDADTVIHFLHSESYWGQDLPPEVIKQSIKHSVCLSLFDAQRQIGFARVITDRAVFGYVEDVFVSSQYRGNGLGQWLMECLLSHPVVSGLKKLMLATEDAQLLYQKYGFAPVAHPEMVMERYNRESYSQFADTRPR